MPKKIAKSSAAPADIIEAMDTTFRSWFEGPTWSAWRTILKAAFALPMTDNEVSLFRTIAERNPPTQRVRELWIIGGRRGGKDSIASLIIAHMASLFDGQRREIAGFTLPQLRRGERASVLCLANGRDQARIVLGYVRSYFEDIPSLAQMVRRETRDGFELHNGVDVTIATNDFRSIRGRAVLCAILDECAFYHDETSARPDVELYNALTPGMMTIKNAMLIGISTPHMKSGLLWRKFKQHFGSDDTDVLVVRAPSIVLNPTLDQTTIDKEIAADPGLKRAEYLCDWREDLASFVSPEVVADAVVAGRHELAPVSGIEYVGALDPAGGSGGDSFTAAVAHRELLSEKLTLDAVREYRPPFSPDQVLSEVAELFRRHGIRRAWGDKWGGEFPREKLRYSGIDYLLLRRSKSEIYAAFLPELNSGRVVLLDHPRLISQLCSLERRTSRGARDSIDHPQGGHDDLANAAAAALIMCSKSAERRVTWSISTDRGTWCSDGTFIQEEPKSAPWPRKLALHERPPERLWPSGDGFLR